MDVLPRMRVRKAWEKRMPKRLVRARALAEEYALGEEDSVALFALAIAADADDVREIARGMRDRGPREPLPPTLTNLWVFAPDFRPFFKWCRPTRFVRRALTRPHRARRPRRRTRRAPRPPPRSRDPDPDPEPPAADGADERQGVRA